MSNRSYQVPVRAVIRGIVPVPLDPCDEATECSCYGLAEERFLNYVAGGVSLVRAPESEDHKILESGDIEHETSFGEVVADHIWAFPVDVTYTTGFDLEGEDITPDEAFGITWDYHADVLRVGIDDDTGTQEIASEMQELFVGDAVETTEDQGASAAELGKIPQSGSDRRPLDPKPGQKGPISQMRGQDWAKGIIY